MTAGSTGGGRLEGDGGCTVAPAATRGDSVDAAGGVAAFVVAIMAGRATTEQTAGNSKVPAPRGEGLGCRACGAVGLSAQTRRRALCRRPPAIVASMGTAPSRRRCRQWSRKRQRRRKWQRRRQPAGVSAAACVGVGGRWSRPPPPTTSSTSQPQVVKRRQPFSKKSDTPTIAKQFPIDVYSRSPKNLSLQQFQKCSKSASVGS